MTRLSKVEKLRAAGTIAPAVRRGSGRKITVVSKTGEPIREMTLDEVQAAIAKRQDIEFSVRDDAPQTVCAGWEGPCPKKARPPGSAFSPDRVASRSGEPWRCATCAGRKRYGLGKAPRLSPCPGHDGPCAFGATPSTRAFSPSATRKRKGQPWRCLRCTAAAKLARLTEEQRSEAARMGHAARRAKKVDKTPKAPPPGEG